MRRFLAALVLYLSVLPVCGWAQSFNGQIGGVVQDSSRALIPGATITLTGQQTGVVTTTVTNEAGAYNFPSVLPGAYRLRAELPGFKPSTLTDVQVGGAAQLRLNFTLEIGSLTESVEVSVTSQALLTESSATIGEVLPEQRVRDLPIVGNDALALISIMPGVVDGTFAGVSTQQVNTVRDGLSVSDGRANNGVFGTTVINPDLVGEIRLILTPVDAEMGRGNAQVQITTRSGTNRYTGAAVWNVRNSGLDANTWDNNRNINAAGVWDPIKPNWENNHSISVSYGGPIVRNKTFFFALFENQLNYRRDLVNGVVLTKEARQGIYRYWEGWNPGNALSNIPSFPASATNGTYPSVDFGGRPVAPPVFPNGTPYTGSLRCMSVFGTVKFDGSPFTQADCPGGIATIPTTGNAWDDNRGAADTTGYIRKVLSKMPDANYFGAGDGLNLARFQWVRGRHGAGGAGISTGTDQNTDRKQINLKIDQNIAAHRLSVGWTYERNDGDNDISNWPGGLSYGMRRDPHVLTANFTSTLTPNLLNEARFGIRVTRYTPTGPWEASDTKELAEEFILPGRDGHRAVVNPGAGGFAFGTTNGVFAASPTQYVGVSAPLFTYSDTLSVTRGVHALKFGAEYRTQSGVGYNNFPCTCPLPRVTGGDGGIPSPLINSSSALPGLLTDSRTDTANMLYFLAGSVSNATMLYWIEGEQNVTDGTWVNYTSGKKRREIVEREWALFAKDDWKATRNLTLNLGLRWEYYAPPYIAGGLTTSTVGGGAGLFGVSRNDTGDLFSNWLQPGNVFLTGYGNRVSAANALRCELPGCDPAKLTSMEFIGPGTSQPDKDSIRPDRNNFGPAVGFSWQVPWFGEGRTTVRGGYQITFGGAGRLAGGASQNEGSTENLFANVPGSTSQATTIVGDFNGRYLDLRNVPELVPVRPTSPAVPGGKLEIYIPYAGVLDAMDPNYTTPYTQNYTLSVTRNVNRLISVDMRYIGTVSKKLRGNFDINASNVFYNPELFEALRITREGGDAELFDQMFAGLNVSGQTTGYGPVGTTPAGGVLQRGSAHLRRNPQFTTNLANGNFFAVASTLASLNTVTGNTLQALPPGLTGVGRRVLRNGCDRIANGVTNIPTRCFPENFLQMNPQLGAANPASRYVTNSGSANYHSMQAQFTLRPAHGINFQGTYTWSRNMQQPGGGFTDPLNRAADYAVTGRAHDFRANGGFELPIGPNKLLLGNSAGWLARLTERWQMNMIFQLGSGNRSSITASNMFYANGRADVVGPWNNNGGKVTWGTGTTGTYFTGTPYITVPDPQCAAINRPDSMGFNLSASCTLDAIADASTGQILLQQPQPGHRGTLGSQTVVLPGFRAFDANLQKSFRIGETRTVSIRMDATNVLNSPDVDNPSLAITSNNNTFGQVGGKGTSHREYRGQIRITF